ncbi:hypothetical protein H8356DRAFT_1325205 [Neocallimastix lanati (nom. inval.)]|nr:hypothetical protein H8356DRAFT_1325205 [Neocallimastix sp. JGI-2020a]
MNHEEQTFIYAYNITNYNVKIPKENDKLKKTYDCYKDICLCLYLGCTHASQCLFGSCTFIDEATNITPDIPFDNHPIGLCRYNAKANLTECDAVYSYMHCGKLEGASCSIVKYSDGPSDSDNLIIIVYIYLGITVLALVILYCILRSILYHIPITKAILDIRNI